MGVHFLGPYETYDLTAEECQKRTLVPFAPRGIFDPSLAPHNSLMVSQKRYGASQDTDNESDELGVTMISAENISHTYRRAMRKIYETDEEISEEELVEEENWLHELDEYEEN